MNSNNNRENNNRFKLIINNIYLKNIIFSLVHQIHLNLDVSIIKWDQITDNWKYIINYGYIDLLTIWMDKYSDFLELRYPEYRDSLLNQSVKYGHVNIFKYLFNRFNIINIKIKNPQCPPILKGKELVNAFSFKQKAMQLYLINYHSDQLNHTKSLKAAVKADDLYFVELIHSIGKAKKSTRSSYYNNKLLELAVANQSLNMIKLLNRLKRGAVAKHHIAMASYTGNLVVLKYLLKNFEDARDEGKRVKDSSIYEYHDSRWIIKHDTTTFGCPLILAASNGHLEVIKHLMNDDTLWNVYSDGVIQNASRNGHLNVVTFLYGKKWTVKDKIRCFNTVVSKGYLDLVKFLLHQHSSLREDAANHLTESSLKECLDNGHSHVIEYLVNSGCLSSKSISYLKQMAVLKGMKKMVVLLYQLSPPCKESGYKGVINYIKHHNLIEGGNIIMSLAQRIAEVGTTDELNYLYEVYKSSSAWGIYQLQSTLLILTSRRKDNSTILLSVLDRLPFVTLDDLQKVIGNIIKYGNINLLKLVLGQNRYQLKDLTRYLDISASNSREMVEYLLELLHQKTKLTKQFSEGLFLKGYYESVLNFSNNNK